MVHQGRIIKFEYKMVNRLVQGSAADCTKEAIIRYHEAIEGTDDLFMLQVHDQMACSVPKKDVKRGMERVRQAMESVEFDVPMLTEGDVGLTWGNLKTYDKKGEVVWRGNW
jgi:DNA polymerase I-like protein with 3'-5' exonuclease and polymerase domains